MCLCNSLSFPNLSHVYQEGKVNFETHIYFKNVIHCMYEVSKLNLQYFFTMIELKCKECYIINVKRENLSACEHQDLSSS